MTELGVPERNANACKPPPGMAEHAEELRAIKEANNALLDGHSSLAVAYMARRLSDIEDRQKRLINRVDEIAKRLDARMFHFEKKCEAALTGSEALPADNKQRLDGLTERMDKASEVVMALQKNGGK